MPIDKKVLSEIANKSDTSNNVFHVLRARVRNPRSGILKLSNIKEAMRERGFKAPPQEVLSTFRELERAGAGELDGDVFNWSVGLKETAQTALGLKTEPETHRPERHLLVCLDNSRQFEVSLPKDLSPKELEDCLEFVRRSAR